MKIYRASIPDPIEVADVRIDLSTVFTQQLMGEHKVIANWISPTVLDIRLGDYIVVGSEKLYLNRPVNYQKADNLTHRYSASFEGEVYELYRIILRDEGRKRFSYFGDPEELMLLVLENMNAAHPGWTLNIDLPVAYEPQELSFDGDSCRVAMTKIMEAFKLEFRLVQREIIVRQDVGFESIYSFEYGRHLGMYSLIRESKNDTEVITRLYGYGGDKNLPASYRGGANELMFDADGNNYIEANVGIYGVREGVVTFPEIFPRRTGAITAVQANNVVRDSTIDFNLNDHLIGGVVAKIVFKSGALSGYEFDIEKYDHATREITFIPRDEVNGAVIPDTGSFQPEPGDTYTLINIDMPEAYVIAAEAELLAATQNHHIKTKSPQVTYGLPMDEKYVRNNGIALSCGMRVNVKDTDIGLDETIRIYSISFPLVNPAMITAQIADSIPYTADERIKKDLAVVKNQVVEIDRSRIESMRDAINRTIRLKDRVYDPEGNYFDPVNYKANSIETLYFSSGAKSRFYSLNGVEIETNYTGDANKLRISAGKLIHWAISIEGLGYIWEMDQNIFEGLTPAESYFVYAKCNRSALTGTWVASIPPILTEEVEGFYHFQLGTLFEEANGMRFFEFDKGMTFIIGDMIKTGSIQSYDGLNFFNLTTGKFNLGTPTTGMDWDISNPGALTIRGAVISNAILAEDGVIANLKVKSLKTAESGKRMEILAFADPEETLPVHHQKFYDDEGNLAVTIDTNMDEGYVAPAIVSAGIKIEKHGASRKAIMSQNGIMSDGSFMSHPDLGFVQGSLTGILKASVFSAFGRAAGVVGWDADPSPVVPTFGGLFNTLLAYAVHVGVRRVTSGNYTMTSQDCFVSCYNSSGNEILLPANPKLGALAIVRRGNGPVLIKGNGKSIHVQGVGIVSEKGLGASNGQGDCAFMLFDGTYWTFNRLKV